MGSLTIRIRGMLRIKPKLSIIVPFYNSQEHILRCLESIVLFTQTPYEVICVNDGSTDNSVSIVKRFCLTHPQVRLISFKANKGLYHARLEGISNARGSYIGFLDSDDYVSKGYFDLLYAAACQNNADLAVGQVINVNAQGFAYLQSRCARFPYLLPEAEEGSVYEMYWEQQGRCYHWHVVWNKIYKKEIFKSNLEILREQQKHMVMMEDFVFSSVVLKDVHKYVVDTSARYYYVQNLSASTQRKDYTSVKKSLTDMDAAFTFIGLFLKKHGHDVYMNHLSEWKELYKRIWHGRILEMSIGESARRELLLFLYGGSIQKLPQGKEHDDYYYEIAEECWLTNDGTD